MKMKGLFAIICLVILGIGLLFTAGCTGSSDSESGNSGCGGCQACSNCSGNSGSSEDEMGSSHNS
jgi:hypothetical protein